MRVSLTVEKARARDSMVFKMVSIHSPLESGEYRAQLRYASLGVRCAELSR